MKLAIFVLNFDSVSFKQLSVFSFPRFTLPVRIPLTPKKFLFE